VGYDLTEAVRSAVLVLAQDAWVAALDQDGSERRNGQVAELTDRLDLSGWPEGSRVIVRRERPHPGAQLSFTDHDGHRFQAILTDQRDSDIAALERRHRARARIEDHIRNDRDPGLANLPFREFDHNRVWLCLVLIAHDLIAWTKALTLVGELARCEPKRLRYRLLHTAARLAFHARGARLRPAGDLALGERPRPRLRAAQSALRARRLKRRAPPRRTIPPIGAQSARRDLSSPGRRTPRVSARAPLRTPNTGSSGPSDGLHIPGAPPPSLRGLAARSGLAPAWDDRLISQIAFEDPPGA